MILPTKHTEITNSILGIGTEILKYIEDGETISSLWVRVRNLSTIKDFEKFILGLDFLYLIGVIDQDNGLLRKLNQ